MIVLRELSVVQGTFTLSGVQLEIPTGSYAVLMGKTGAGKTTLLEAICGLRPITAGQILLHGRNVTGLTPAARGVGYVPQDGCLFPRLTIREHLAFALVIRRWPEAAIRKRVAELAALLGIEPLLDRRPAGLSGGEVQRVALGRALAMRPGVLLFDEPLSALDEDTRHEMYDLLSSVRREEKVTGLHVTHSSFEAERLADRVYELRNGQVRLVTPPTPSAT